MIEELDAIIKREKTRGSRNFYVHDEEKIYYKCFKFKKT